MGSCLDKQAGTLKENKSTSDMTYALKRGAGYKSRYNIAILYLTIKKVFFCDRLKASKMTWAQAPTIRI